MVSCTAGWWFVSITVEVVDEKPVTTQKTVGIDLGLNHTRKVMARQGVVQKIGRFYPSSKTCHRCGHVKAELALSERQYRCEQCGLVCDRDHNASLNILREGLRLVGRI